MKEIDSAAARLEASSMSREVEAEIWKAKEAKDQARSPNNVTLLRANNWIRRDTGKWEQSIAHRYYQEPRPVDFDGVSGWKTKILTEAFVKSMCPNWVRIYVTIQFQGKPSLEYAHRVLNEAAILRDKYLIGSTFNRPRNARYRTMDWFFEEQGSGANSGNRHWHGLVLIAPDHPAIHGVEEAITQAVIEGMVRHLTKSRSRTAESAHRLKLVNRQRAASGKVVVAERCLNSASCLGYSMKQFDISKEHFASLDYMPTSQLKRLGQLNKDAFTKLATALPGPPRYARRLTALEREAQSTPHPEGASR